MNHENKLPNALIIGAQKSATTWLQKRLAEHPDVFMVPGEVHFFDNERHYGMGVPWYAARFSDAREQAVRCEKSGAYLWTTCEGAEGEPLDKVQRMHNLLPEAKLLITLRDPVERAISAWNHNSRSGAIPPTYKINEMLSTRYAPVMNQYGVLTRGLYCTQISHYLELYRRDQLCILFYETDVKQSPDSSLRKVCRFLGIGEELPFSQAKRVENRARATTPGVWGNYLLSGLPRYGALGLPRRGWRTLDKLVFSKLPVPSWPQARPSDAIVGQLYDYYRAENARLAEMLGDIPESWHGPSRAK